MFDEDDDVSYSHDGRLIPESPIGRCVAIVTAASMADNELVMTLLQEAHDHHLLEAMAAVAVVLFNGLRKTLGERGAKGFLEQVGLSCVALDEELALLAAE